MHTTNGREPLLSSSVGAHNRWPRWVFDLDKLGASVCADNGGLLVKAADGDEATARGGGHATHTAIALEVDDSRTRVDVDMLDLLPTANHEVTLGGWR